LTTDIENKNISNGARLGLLPKVYIWSILLEPLLFFIVAGQQTTGIGGNISRVLQLFIVLSLFLKLLMTPWSKIRIFNPLFYQYKWYSYYLTFLVFSCVYGYFNGYYSVDSFSENQSSEQSGFSAIINSQFIRPFFEYLVAIYYFVYFVILPKYLLDSSEGIDYFFKVFMFTFLLCLFVGVIDFLLVSLIGYEWIPRHLSDFRHVGIRFHGLAGEPRDAFVYIGFGMGILFLRDVWLNQRKTTNFILTALFICMMLTQSSSGFIGLIIAIGLIAIYRIPTIPIRYLLSLSLLITIGSVAIYFAVINSYRTMLYIEAIPDALTALQTSNDLPPIIMAQIVNIYPVFLRFGEVMELNFLPLIFGSGLGTTSLANSIFMNVSGVYNPHANIIRVVFESGLIGLIIFINAFLQPIKKVIKDIGIKERYMLYMLLILGLNFGHRSSTLFIFLGISMLIFNYKNNNNHKITLKT